MWARSFATASAAALTVGVLAGCVLGGVTGSGAVTSETRDVGTFDRIEVSGGIGVTVHIGPTQPLQLETHENLHSVIATDVAGGVLKIHGRSSYLAHPAPHVTVTVSALNGVSASGGSQVTADGLAADTLSIDLSGGASITATGTADVVAIDGSGGSRANLFGLAASSVVLDLSGGSAADVQATADVTGSASGGSRATVRGGAAVRVSASGGGEVVSQ